MRFIGDLVNDGTNCKNTTDTGDAVQKETGPGGGMLFPVDDLQGRELEIDEEAWDTTGRM